MTSSDAETDFKPIVIMLTSVWQQCTCMDHLVTIRVNMARLRASSCSLHRIKSKTEATHAELLSMRSERELYFLS